MSKVGQYLKLSPYAQLCSHLFGYHYAQNYAGIVCQGLQVCPAQNVHLFPHYSIHDHILVLQKFCNCASTERIQLVVTREYLMSFK